MVIEATSTELVNQVVTGNWSKRLRKLTVVNWSGHRWVPPLNSSSFGVSATITMQ